MNRIAAWLPAVVWMVIIFLLSSRTRIQVSEEVAINFLIFKSLHIIEYGILFLLFVRAFRFEHPKKGSRYWLYSAFIWSVVYASTDELHQTLVPTREGHPRDVIIDTIGIILSWVITRQFYPVLPKKLRSLATKWLFV